MRNALVVLALLGALPSLARADIPPGPLVDPCTVANEEATGATGCIVCTVHVADPEVCRRTHSSTRSWRCRGIGSGSTVPEVWCDTDVFSAQRRRWDVSSDAERGERIGHIVGTVIPCCCFLVLLAIVVGVVVFTLRKQKR